MYAFICINIYTYIYTYTKKKKKMHVYSIDRNGWVFAGSRVSRNRQNPQTSGRRSFTLPANTPALGWGSNLIALGWWNPANYGECTGHGMEMADMMGYIIPTFGSWMFSMSVLERTAIQIGKLDQIGIPKPGRWIMMNHHWPPAESSWRLIFNVRRFSNVTKFYEYWIL